MSAMASQITSLAIVYSTVYPGADQSKHQSSASLAFVKGIQRWPVNSPHKGPVTRKMFPFEDVIINHTFFVDTDKTAMGTTLCLVSLLVIFSGILGGTPVYEDWEKYSHNCVRGCNGNRYTNIPTDQGNLLRSFSMTHNRISTINGELHNYPRLEVSCIICLDSQWTMIDIFCCHYAIICTLHSVQLSTSSQSLLPSEIILHQGIPFTNMD